MPVIIIIMAIVLGLACSSGEQAAVEAQAETSQAPAQAATQEPEAAPNETLPEPPAPSRARVSTPASEFHLDDSDSAYRPRRRQTPSRAERATIHITLKSTPNGAMAAVDGVAVGRTPAFWEGEVTGKPHEFTFVLPGHAMARYRFVPTSHGIVHGTLKKLSAEAGETIETGQPGAARPGATPDVAPRP